MKSTLMVCLLFSGIVACERGPDRSPPPAATAEGQRVYGEVCFACHGTGAGGAPKLGMADQWEPRMAQGRQSLYQHALFGFTGRYGTMPAKGGRTSLSDDEVKLAVDYMLSKLPPG